MNKFLQELPIIAIIRGVTPNECLSITEAVYKAGIRVIEVPLNSPQACKSIEIMASEFGNKMLVGAGTVLTEQQVVDVKNAGGKIIVSPNMNPKVIQKSKAEGLHSFPGVMTVSECFDALDNGADGLKLFPSDVIGPKGLKAYKAVLPKEIPVFAVGGINESNMKDWIDAGATGFGLGSSLFKPGCRADFVFKQASAAISSYKNLHKKT